MDGKDFQKITIRSSSPQDIVEAEDQPKVDPVKIVDPTAPPIDDKEEEPVVQIKEEEPTSDDILSEDTPAVEVDGEKPQSDEGDSDEGDDEFNPYYSAALEWQKDGFLGEDEDIPKDITPTELKERYYKHNRDSIYNEALEASKKETLEALKAVGVTERNILVAQALDAGTDPADLAPGTRYAKLAKTSLKDLSEDKQEEKMIEVISERYKERNFSDEEAAAMIDTLMSEGKLEKEFTVSLDFFAGKDQEFNASLAKQMEEREKAIAEIQRKNRETWVTISANKEIRGEKFTDEEFKEFERAIQAPTQVVEANGQLMKITEFQEFYQKMTNDLETQLYLFKLYKYRDTEMDSLRSRVKDEVETEVLSGISRNSKIIKTTENKNIKKKTGDRISFQFS